MQIKIFPKNKTESITAYILERPESRIKITEIANILKINKGMVSLVVSKLEKSKIIKNKRVDLNNPTTKALKILVTITNLTNKGFINIIKKYSLSAGLYGSSASGIDTYNSDIDIWIKPTHELSQLETSKLSRKLSDALNRNVQLIVLDKNQLDKIKNESKNFYYSIIFGSIILFGDGIE